jgi:hypothetical protein
MASWLGMAWRLASLGLGVWRLASLGLGSTLGLWLWLRACLALLVDAVGFPPVRVGLRPLGGGLSAA